MVRKILLIILLLTANCHLLKVPVFADYRSAQKDYVYQYSQYRNAYDSYQVTKSAYLTYRTLTAQNEATNQMRQVLQIRNNVISSYYNLLQEKLNLADNLTLQAKSTFSDIKKSEISWLNDYQKRLDAPSSTEDLNGVAGDFESRFPQMDLETKQTIGTILLTKELNLKNKVVAIIADFDSQLTRIRQDGEDTSIWDRYLLITKNKLDLHEKKYSEAKTIFYPLESRASNINIFSGQQRLTEANQYLREIMTNLLEIVRSITKQA